MAVGDDAALFGYPLVPNTGEEGKVKWGAREINRTRDFLAQLTRNLFTRNFNTVDQMVQAQGSYAGQRAQVLENGYIYEWNTVSGWRMFSGAGNFTPGISGAAPFNIGTNAIFQGRWQVTQAEFRIGGRIVFGGGVNLDTSGQHVALTQLPTDIMGFDFPYNAQGHGIYLPKNGGTARVPVLILPTTTGQADLRLYNTRGSMAYADESFSAIAGEQQSDEFHFSISGFRTNI